MREWKIQNLAFPENVVYVLHTYVAITLEIRMSFTDGPKESPVAFR